MFPAQFDYHRATTVDEAFELLSETGGEILAGGHSLLPTMKSGLSSPAALVDIGGIDDLKGVEITSEETTIGALTTYAEVVETESLRENARVFADAVQQVGDVQVRNRGTVGGNLAHADPASDVPAAAIAADATLVVTGPDGEREVPAEEFFLGMYETDVSEGELLTRVRVPHSPETGGTYLKKPSPSSGYAMVGVAAAVTTDGEEITDARLACNGAMDHATRLEAVEEALVGGTAADAAEAATHATDGVEEWMLMDDVQASAEFRSHLLEVYTARAVEDAADRAQ